MRRVVLPIILLLAGCTFGRPETTAWERTDATPEEAAGDLQACRHAAQAKVDQDLQADQDMGADPTSQGSLASNLTQFDAEKRVSALTRDCMVALDYHPAGNSAP
jgi:hypothetical protein